MSATLHIPSSQYEKSYREALTEFQNEGREISWHLLFDSREPFEDFVERLVGYTEGRSLPKGFVPESVFWLVDEEGFIGSVSIRHELTQHLREIGGHIGYSIRPSKRRRGYGTLILRLALQEARLFDLKRVLVTCDETNAASRKIIEKSGGVLDWQTPQGSGNGKPDKLRFWIEL